MKIVMVMISLPLLCFVILLFFFLQQSTTGSGWIAALAKKTHVMFVER
jgi:hypothetical protein